MAERVLTYRNPRDGKPYSKSHLKTIHNQLRAIFNHAVRYHKLSENPARTVGNMGSKAIGLQRIRVYDLRHSHVSLLIHMGYSAVAIAERTGHESIDITFRYAHLFPTVQRQMAADLNALQEGGDENVC